jgi:geranylgeranyl pyrophosphate synthase
MARFQQNALEILNTYPETETREALRELVYFITERNG